MIYGNERELRSDISWLLVIQITTLYFYSYINIIDIYLIKKAKRDKKCNFVKKSDDQCDGMLLYNESYIEMFIFYFFYTPAGTCGKKLFNKLFFPYLFSYTLL